MKALTHYSLISLFLTLLPHFLRATPTFEAEVITADFGGRAAIADMDKDGFNDVVLHVWGSQRGKVADGQIIWYRYPDWKPTTVISERHLFGDMILACDLDGDGDEDLIGAAGDDVTADLWWYENENKGSRWIEHHFGLSGKHSEIKDLEICDMDGDGRIDVVSRLKKEVVIWYQEVAGGFTRISQEIAGREGMGIADLDGDGDEDVVLNGYWLENSGERLGDWKRYDIDPRFFQPGTQPKDAASWRDFSVRVQFEDINGDGEKNLILCHAEHAGFPVIWYTSEDPRGGAEAWTAHEVGIVDYAHTLHAADFDNDGDIDILAAGTRHKLESRITIFYNQGEGQFVRTSLAESGPVYAAALGDIDNDGDLDLVSSYSWEDAPLKVWRNHLVALEASKPVKAISIRLSQIVPPSQPTVYEAFLENRSLTELLDDSNGTIDADDLLLQEVDQNGEVLDVDVPFQLLGPTPANPIEINLTGIGFLPRGEKNKTERYFRLIAGQRSVVKPLVHYRYPAFDAGVPSIKVTTGNGNWWYDTAGAAFSSIVDRDGNDWLNYNLKSGANGRYRGLPNMGYPEGYMHPGSDASRTEIIRSGPLIISLYSESLDGKWAGQWDMYPHEARLTVLRVSHPFWFLYEGTPGGSIDAEGDRWLRGDGSSGTLSERWDDRDHKGWGGENWIAFTDAHTDRSLLLINHSSLMKHSFYLMEEAMTVFGFGRIGMEKFFHDVPVRFSVSLFESKDGEGIKANADAQLRPPLVEVTTIR